MKSCAIDLAFIKFVQDGSQKNSQFCTNIHAWTSANKIWIAVIKKVTPSWTESSLVNETCVHRYKPECKRQIIEWKHPQSPIRKKIQKPNINRKIDSYSFLGFTRPNTGTLSGEGFNSKQCSLQWDAYWQAAAWNSKQTPRITVERHHVVAWQCPSTYCCPHGWNTPDTQVWGIGSPSV